MSWKSAWKINGVELSVIKEEYYDFFLGFSAGDSSVGGGSTHTIFDNHYLTPPLNMAHLFNNGAVAQGDTVKFCTFPEGKYLGFYILDYSNNQYNTSGTVEPYIYNADGSKYLSKPLCSTPINVRNQYAPTDGYPWYCSLLYNDETKEAAFIILSVYIGHQSSKSFWCSTTPVAGQYFVTRKELYNFIKGTVKEYDPDPWSDAGYTGIGGGEGSFDFSSDVIELPVLPTLNATDTGFVQLYSSGLGQIRALASYLWTDNFLENLLKVTDDPLSIIMSIYMYPFNIPSGKTKKVRAGNIETPVVMSVPDNQYFELDCGEFPVPAFYGAYLDYEPFSKCEIFLPYCGSHTLSLDDIVGKTLNIRYRIDLLSGACVAYIIVDGCPMYMFNGMCAMNIPITSQSFISMYSSILGTVATVTGASKATVGLASDVASNVMGCKPDISRGGSSAGNLGFMGVQKPTLIFTVPNVAIPKGQSKYMGYPVFSTYKLSDLEGYTEIESILTSNFGRATNGEVAEIEKLLKGGVIL